MRTRAAFERLAGLLRRALESLQALHDPLDVLRALFQGLLRLAHLEALLLLLAADVGEFGADGLAPLLGLLGALRELQVLDLEGVLGLARAGEFLAQPPRLALRLDQLRLESACTRFHRCTRRGNRRRPAAQFLDLALPLQHPVQFRLRAVEDHALAAEQVAGTRHEQPARRQDAREYEAVLAFGKDEDVRQRVLQVGGDSGARTRDHGGERQEMRARGRSLGCAAFDEHGEVARGRILEQFREPAFVGKARGIEAHAQRRLHRIVPARLHVDRLPEALGAVQRVRLRPVGEPRVVVQLGLLRLERLQRRLELGQLAGALLQRLLQVAPLLFQERELFLGRTLRFLDGHALRLHLAALRRRWRQASPARETRAPCSPA